jgi:VWFA-related protein
MKYRANGPCSLSVLAFTLILCLVAVVRAQNPSPTGTPANNDDEVIRIDTNLVQTDVTVFDKDGKFVDGLKADQFVLRINGQDRPIPFFERVTAGSVTDVSGVRTPGEGSTQTGRGRTIIFFVDDVHLTQPGIVRTRKSLTEFIDRSMAPNDQVAITSTSGEIGFLQQFTDDKYVLHEAVAKLASKYVGGLDMGEPPMSEYMAAQVRNGNKQTIDYFVAKLLQANTIKTGAGDSFNMMDPESARIQVVNRANEISSQTAPSTDITLRMLEGLMRTISQYPGRKLVFMISDGFLLTDREASSPDKLRRITDAAGKAGVVIYTIDARGLVTGVDVSRDSVVDANALLTTSSIGELAASQDGMNALARDTGGTPFRNTNAPMAELVQKVLAESSVYYLLAWQPAEEEEKSRKFGKIEVRIAGRPELKVRVRNAYYRTLPLALKTYGKKSKDPVKMREDEIRTLIDATLPQQQIPTSVGVTVIPVLTNSSRLTTTIRIDRSALAFMGVAPDVAADMDIGAILYNKKGKPIDSFVGRIRVLPLTDAASERERTGAIFVRDAWLAPGLYQIRVAVRDIATGRIGSAMQWVQVSKM